MSPRLLVLNAPRLHDGALLPVHEQVRVQAVPAGDEAHAVRPAEDAVVVVGIALLPGRVPAPRLDGEGGVGAERRPLDPPRGPAEVCAVIDVARDGAVAT